MPIISFKDKTMRSMAGMMVIKRHLHRLAKGKRYSALNPIVTMILNQMEMKKLVKRYRENFVSKAA